MSRTTAAHLCARYVIAMSGLVASGKSTLARALADAIDAPLVVADEVRNDLLGTQPRVRACGVALLENYAPELPEKVYDEVLRRADKLLQDHPSVVVDACFGTCHERAALRVLAERFAASLLFVECRAPESVIRERLARRAERDGVPLADWQEIAERFQMRWEDPRELPEASHILADTTRPLSALVTKLCCFLETPKE